MAMLNPLDVRRIFEMALERPGREREFFVARACGEDRLLRDEVARLLGIDGDLGAPPNPDPQAREARRNPRRIGRYQLLRRLGQGGSSTVFLARRHDTDVAPEVAVKILRSDLPAIAKQRFALEQRILAELEHPNIARFLDSGVERGAEGGRGTEERHFVVLERVEGSPITSHCDARCLGLAARLTLVRTICGAVASAHRHLVVHRDLKPGNLLVTDQGVPKVLDFGIAKMLDGTGDETLPHQRAMTPSYASPEQWRGEPVTTASDIYSLGVVLYELLSGLRPWRQPEAQRQGLDDPLPPSLALERADPVTALAAATARGFDVPGLRKALRGDLDAIVLKAIDPDPGARYASVDHFAEDLRRWLAEEPIAARDSHRSVGHLLYRGRKWLRRNRLAGAGLLLSIALAVLLVGGLTLHHFRVEEERRAAEAARAEAQRIASFLERSFADADPRGERGGYLSLREFLVASAGRLERDLAEDPVARADLLHTLGTALANLGATADAEPLLRQALELRPADGPGRATTLAELSAVTRAQGLYGEARRFANEALSLQRSVEAAAEIDDLTLARTLRQLAMACLFEGDHTAAERHARRALDLVRRAQGPQSAGHRAEEGAAHVEALLTLASVLADDRRYTEALALSGEALELLAPTGGRESLLASDVLQLQGISQRGLGDLDAALVSYTELVAIRRRILGPKALRYGEGLHSFAATVWRTGDPVRTRALLEETLAVYRDVEPPNELATAQALSDLGALESNLGNLEAARLRLEEAWSLRQRLAGDRPEAVVSLVRLAQLEAKRGEARLASHYRRQALAALALAPQDVDRMEWLEVRVLVGKELEAAGERAVAEEVFRGALREAQSLLEPGDPTIRYLLGVLN